MAAKLTMENIRKRAAQETEQGQAELLARLRKLSPAELTKVDPKIVARLTVDQRMALFCAPGIHQDQKQNNPARVYQASIQFRKRSPWRLVPPALRGPLLGTATGVAMALLGIFNEPLIFNAERLLIQPHPLSSHARSWAACIRLSQQTDNCLYRVQRGLSWNDASTHLGMDVSEMRRVNPHLSPLQTRLTRGDLLIVWRGITPILENSHVQ